MTLRLLTLFLTLILAFSFLGPNFILANSDHALDYDFAIYDRNQQVFLFSDKVSGVGQRKFTFLESRPITTMEAPLGLWGAPYFAPLGDTFISKTKDSHLDFGDFIIIMDPENPHQPLIDRPNDRSSAYTMVNDGDNVFAIYDKLNYFIFDKYDSELKPLKSMELDKGDLQIAANQWLSIDDRLYLLVGYIFLEEQEADPSNIEIHSEIWAMTKDLEIVEKYPLSELQGFNIRMTYDGDYFYITNTVSTSDKDSDIPSNSVYRYRLDDEESAMVLEQTIHLSEKAPRDIFYDEVNHRLFIFHDPHQLNYLRWTIYDLDSQAENILEFPHHRADDLSFAEPFFTMQEGEYYFLIRDELMIYDPLSGDLLQVDLSDTKIEKPQTIIFH